MANKEFAKKLEKRTIQVLKMFSSLPNPTEALVWC